MPHKHPTRKAIRECAEAMVKHLQLGWSKESLDLLEQLWWQCHKPNRQLMSPSEYKIARTARDRILQRMPKRTRHRRNIPQGTNLSSNTPHQTHAQLPTNTKLVPTAKPN